MSLYDIHAHLADPRILPDADRIIQNAKEAGVRGILVNAARLQEWNAVCELSRHPLVFGALGLHPFCADCWQDGTLDRLRKMLLEHDRLVAVGEIGLDFWNGRDDMDQQITVFRSQLRLARELDLPVILHNRKSWGECLGLLKDSGSDSLRGVCHCFNGSRELARQLLDRGLDVSFCGPITYDNARRIRDVAAYIPADRLLTETDAPDLPPKQVKPGRSLPQHVCYILEALAEIRKTTVTCLAIQVQKNFYDVLKLSPHQ